MTFKPGQSGNPSGKAKKSNKASGMAREHTEAAVLRLVKALASEDDNVAIKAANSLLDRGWGKPQEFVDITSDGEQVAIVDVTAQILQAVPTEQLEEIIKTRGPEESTANIH